MTTEERLRDHAKFLLTRKPREITSGSYLDELLIEAADEMRRQAKTIGELALSLAAVRQSHPCDAWAALVQAGVEEAARAMRKHPQPNYVISKVAEEAGEVVKEAIHSVEGRAPLSNVHAEMVQLIAMLYRLWIEGDEVHGLPPVRTFRETS